MTKRSENQGNRWIAFAFYHKAKPTAGRWIALAFIIKPSQQQVDGQHLHFVISLQVQLTYLQSAHKWSMDSICIYHSLQRVDGQHQHFIIKPSQQLIDGQHLHFIINPTQRRCRHLKTCRSMVRCVLQGHGKILVNQISSATIGQPKKPRREEEERRSSRRSSADMRLFQPTIQQQVLKPIS